MKLDFFLFLFALMLAFLTGNITYSIKSGSKGGLNDLQKIRNIHLELQEELTPYKRLDLNIEYPTPEHLKLLLNKQPLQSPKNGLILNSTECLRAKLNQISSNFINKETLWMAYLCNQIESLPANFFSTPPFVSTSGESFSFLRFKLLRKKVDRINWLEKYAHTMHIQELKKLDWPNSSVQRFLIDLPTKALKKLTKGVNVFYTPNFYFIKNGKLKYFVLETKKVRRFFARANYKFDQTNKNCIFKIGEICWKKERKSIQQFLSQSIVVLFIGTIIILSLTANSFFTRLRRKKMDEERKKHALRVLTHELRTPIAAMMVLADNLQNNFEKIPQDLQEDLLKIESQIYRLKHLAEKSQGYLQTTDQKLIHLKKVKIHSIKEFLSDIVFEYGNEDIKLIENERDFSIDADPYWLKMCITNLIENATRYGKPPIEISYCDNSKNFEIFIKDYGDISFNNIKELLKSTHSDSKGLGMGMNIVNKTILEMKGQLSLSSNPTIFSIKLSKTKEEDDE